MSQEQSQVRARAIALVKSAIAQVCEQGDLIVPSNEAQVHQAVDLLRASPCDGDLLRAAEQLSCVMLELRNYRRQGRINAYASKLIRVRKTYEALA